MSTPTLTEDEIAELREIYSHYDANDDGVMQIREFAALLDALDADLTEEQVAAGMAALDADGNGLIDFDEFVAWWADR